MSVQKLRTTLNAGESVSNMLTGSKFEFLTSPSVVTLWASQSGAGSPNGEIELSLGNVVVSEPINPNTAGTAGNISRDSDGIGSGAGDAQDRVQIRARNSDATNPVTLDVLVEINEL